MSAPRFPRPVRHADDEDVRRENHERYEQERRDDDAEAAAERLDRFSHEWGGVFGDYDYR